MFKHKYKQQQQKAAALLANTVYDNISAVINV